jgi:hypothetical protein
MPKSLIPAWIVGLAVLIAGAALTSALLSGASSGKASPQQQQSVHLQGVILPGDVCPTVRILQTDSGRYWLLGDLEGCSYGDLVEVWGTLAYYITTCMEAQQVAVQHVVGACAPDDTMVCLNAANDDSPDDALVNDGCPQAGTISEAADWCGGGAGDGVDQDRDIIADDGCPGGPAVNGAISEGDNHCTNSVNDDSRDDIRINDGCTKLGDYSEAGSVGGIAELPDVAGDSGSSTGTYAALAGGLAAAALALSSGAWYARRRWVR